jgi:hypothetical protein
MRAIAAGATRHSEIAPQAGLAPSSLSPKLDRLEDVDHMMGGRS